MCSGSARRRLLGYGRFHRLGHRFRYGYRRFGLHRLRFDDDRRFQPGGGVQHSLRSALETVVRIHRLTRFDGSQIVRFVLCASRVFGQGFARQHEEIVL